jgi:mevalonate kinase
LSKVTVTIRNPAPIDHFAKLDTGIQILKVLHDLPIEKLPAGGYSTDEMCEALSKYRKELLDMGLRERRKKTRKFADPETSTTDGVGFNSQDVADRIKIFQESGQVRTTERTPDSDYRYKLDIETLYYIHSLHSPRPYITDVKRTATDFFRFGHVSIEGDPIIDVTIETPGSTIFSGEHGALLGQPVIVLPIPLFLAVRAKVSRYDGQTCVHPFEHPPNPFSNYNDLWHFSPALTPNRIYGEGEFRDKVSDVTGLFQSKLIEHSQNLSDERGFYVTLQIQSQIPPGCGLGSSGALCAALAVLLDQVIHLGEEKYPIESLHRRNPEQLLKDNDYRLKEIFLNAMEFERKIQGKTSGVGPFASLVGGDCFTPILYDQGARIECEPTWMMNEILDLKKERCGEALSFKHEIGSKKAKEYLSTQLAIANIFTTQSRPQLQTTFRRDLYEQRLKKKDCRRDFVESTEKLWKNLSDEEEREEDDVEDVVTCINLFGEYEEGYLKMLRAENEETARDLIYRLRCAGLGAKYTGGGFGGDIIVVGLREKVKAALIPNYFPVHFSTFNLTRKSSQIEIQALPRIVDNLRK